MGQTHGSPVGDPRASVINPWNTHGLDYPWETHGRSMGQTYGSPVSDPWASTENPWETPWETHMPALQQKPMEGP